MFLVILILVIIVKKKLLIIFLVVLFIGISGFLIWKYVKNNNTKSNYETSKISANQSESEQSNENSNTNKEDDENNNESSSSNVQSPQNNMSSNSSSTTNNTPSTQLKEEILTSFSTKIYTNDPARQNNISITCSTLNGTTVKNGATFSFCNTLGPSSSKKGYQEADIYDNDGNKKKGLGGGNCQVSTTLYNAVLAVPSLTVTERHAHSNYVPYIQKGKDAAVAYGSYDFKFINNSGNDIKIVCANDAKAISVSLVALKKQ